MALVKLRNALGREIKIPSGAVNAYNNLGYFAAGELEKSSTPAVSAKNTKEEVTEVEPDKIDDFDNTESDVTGDNEKTDDEIFVEIISKKPLTSWNKDEVKRYAGIYNIDLTGTKSASEAKERIKEFMSDAE